MHVKLLANTLPWRNGMGPLVSVFDGENQSLNGGRNEETGIDIGVLGPIGNRLTDDFFGIVDITYPQCYLRRPRGGCGWVLIETIAWNQIPIPSIFGYARWA